MIEILHAEPTSLDNFPPFGDTGSERVKLLVLKCDSVGNIALHLKPRLLLTEIVLLIIANSLRDLLSRAFSVQNQETKIHLEHSDSHQTAKFAIIKLL